MAETSGELPHVRHGHETRDVNIRFIGLFGLSMVALLVGSLALIGWLFGVFAGTPVGHGRLAPRAEIQSRPPAPPLQTSPTRDMQEMLHAENARLQSYGWIDHASGIARIPIDRAMKLLATQGLPSWNEVSALPTERRSATPQENR